MNSLIKQQDDITRGKFNFPFSTYNKYSIEEINKRKIMKLSAWLGRNLERVFEFNKEEKFAYYANLKSEKPKKQVDTNRFECEIECKRDLNEIELKTWTDKDIENDIRLKISVWLSWLTTKNAAILVFYFLKMFSY